MYRPPNDTPPSRGGTSGFAVAALAFGLFGVVPVAIVLGVAALVQIRRYSQRGKGLAITGLAAAATWAVAIAAVTILGDPRGPAEQDTGGVLVANLTVGTCIKYLDERFMPVGLPTVPCTDKHEGEVFAIFNLPPGDFPGEAGLERIVEQECADRLASYAPAAMDDPELGLFAFTPRSWRDWELGDRRLTCLTWHEKKRTGSIRP